MVKADKDSRGRFARGQAINPAALKQARQEAGLTLAAAADGIVSRQALHLFETGKARPVESNLQAIAARLGVDVNVLRARPHDPREEQMRELAAEKRWSELHKLTAAVLADINVTDRSQAVARFYLARAILDEAPDEALGMLRQVRGQLARVREPWLAAEARDWEGAALYLLQQPDAIDVGREALARYRALTDPDPAVEARMLEHIGTYQLQRGEIAEAMNTYRQAISSGVLDLARLGNIYHGLASGCTRLGQDRQALDYFERAFQLMVAHHEVHGQEVASANLARLENDYGELLLRTGQLDRAAEKIQAALDHFTAIGVAAARSHAMLSMGDLERQRGNITEAIQWTERTIEVADELGETVALASAYQQLGELAAVDGDLDRFETSFRRAISLLEDAVLHERRAQAVERYRRAVVGATHRQGGR
jgi:tetratricopeptide (TPR) repeat protein